MSRLTCLSKKVVWCIDLLSKYRKMMKTGGEKVIKTQKKKFKLGVEEWIQRAMKPNISVYLGEWTGLLFTVLILFVFSTGLISCGGKQRPPSDSEPSRQTGTDKSPVVAQSNPGGTAPTPLESPPENKVRFEAVKTIFEERCIACHNSNAAIPNYMDFAVIKERVENGKLLKRVWTLKDDPAKGMPLGNATGMTDEERELIVKWIEDGGLE